MPKTQTRSPQVNLYRIQNLNTKAWWEDYAFSPEDACFQAGWPIGVCFIRQYTSVISDTSTESLHRGGGWEQVQLAEYQDRLPF